MIAKLIEANAHATLIAAESAIFQQWPVHKKIHVSELQLTIHSVIVSELQLKIYNVNQLAL